VTRIDWYEGLGVTRIDWFEGSEPQIKSFNAANIAQTNVPRPLPSRVSVAGEEWFERLACVPRRGQFSHTLGLYGILSATQLGAHRFWQGFGLNVCACQFVRTTEPGCASLAIADSTSLNTTRTILSSMLASVTSLPLLMPHPILEINELLRLVVDALVQTSPRSAVSFALTCQSLEELTLSSLWKEQRSLTHLMKVLPAHTWVQDWRGISFVSGYNFSADCIRYKFPQVTEHDPSTEDWARLHRYASWMRGLHLYSCEGLPDNTLHRLSTP